MAMNSLLQSALTLFLLITFHFLSASNCLHLHQHHPSPTTTHIRGLLYEEKLTRLGSRPPSCHSKCNLCHPCMAVQVPTLPGHNRVNPAGVRVKTLEFYDQTPSNRYSNYKPLGWKCRCGGHLYNP